MTLTIAKKRTYSKARNDKIAKAMTKHGKAATPEYKSWEGMKSRCNSPTNRAYQNYGARGITVCERWTKFENFFADMGPRPHGTSIDRIDVNGNYEPSNCRWATNLEQRRNKRNNRKLTFNGESLCITEWAQRTGLKRRTIEARLTYGWSVEDALTTARRRNGQS